MVLVPLPRDLCQKVADRATMYARQDLQGKGWRAARSLSPIAQEGQVGIKTSVKYLMFQEKGIKPFLMKWVDGRTVTLSTPGGGINFRKGSHVGEPGYVNIPGRGRVWRQSRWLHPGLAGTHTMQNALKKALGEIHTDLKQDLMKALKGEYH